MQFNRFLSSVVFVAGTLCAQASIGATVNGDVEGNPPNDATYIGDDGVLSTTGGTGWNSISHFVDATNLADEFGNITTVGVTWLGFDNGPAIDMAATNDLQDSGTSGDGFQITGLQSGGTYNLALYAMENSGGCVTDAGGANCGFWTIAGAPTYLMPGLEGRDYALFGDLVPYDLGGGILGLKIDSLDGSISGFQLAAPVPLPAAVWLLGSAIGLLGLKRRR